MHSMHTKNGSLGMDRFHALTDDYEKLDIRASRARPGIK